MSAHKMPVYLIVYHASLFLQPFSSRTLKSPTESAQTLTTVPQSNVDMNGRDLSDKKVLCVGLLCLDLISICDGYPEEDQDQRCLDQRWQRGGNASNNCTVLSLLGVPCALFATLGTSQTPAGFLEQDLAKYKINTEICVRHSDCECPLSVAIINKLNGSRTIIHSNKNLPEITFDDFMDNIDLSEGKYKWIHFEGRRSVASIKQMLHYIHSYNLSCQNEEEKITTSIEIEKRNPELVELCCHADYVFVGKEHAMMVGIKDKEEAVKKYLQYSKKGGAVICPWGETGAAARRNPGPTVTSPCHSPAKVVDTLGAGDTFIAAAISVLCQHRTSLPHEEHVAVLQEAIDFGCKVAGAKCGMQGFDGLKAIFNPTS